MRSIKVEIGKKIKSVRQSRDMTRSDLSFLATVHYTTLMNIENGKTYPRLETLQKLIMILDVEMKELFDDG